MSFLMERIGLFGGSFDPIHYGHLNIALTMKERWNLSKVFFCPTNISPLRQSQTPLDNSHRLKMVTLGVDDISGFEVFDDEIKRKGISYTIDTIHNLLSKYPEYENRLALIVGEDVALDFPLWKDFDSIIKKTTILTGTRTFQKSIIKIEQKDLPSNIKEQLKAGLTPIPLLDISSSTIRERLKNGLYCKHLVPAKVLDYIYENQLYSYTKNQ